MAIETNRSIIVTVVQNWILIATIELKIISALFLGKSIFFHRLFWIRSMKSSSFEMGLDIINLKNPSY